ncbi:MAG: MlaD family protein [Polyangiaceae bacterium]
MTVLMVASSTVACSSSHRRVGDPQATLAKNAEATEAFAELRRDWSAASPSERTTLGPRINELKSKYASDPIVRYADLYLAWIALEQGNAQHARQLAQQVKLGPTGNARDLGTLVEGAMLSRQGKSAEALELLMPLLGKLFDPFARELLHDEATRAGLAAQRWSDLIDTVLERRLRDSVDVDEILVRKAVEDAVGQIPTLVLERAFQQMQKDLDDGIERHSPMLRKIVTRRLATIALERGDTALARRLLAGGDTLGTLGASGASVVQLAGTAEEPESIVGRAIGVVLSGGSFTLRARAAEVSQGVLTAIEAHPTKVRIVTREADNAEAARAAVASLSRAGVSLIIGGLDGEPAKSLADAAEQANLTAVLLAPPDRWPSSPGWTFQAAPDLSEADSALLNALGPRCSNVLVVGPPSLGKTAQVLSVRECPASPLGAPGAIADTWTRASVDALLITGDRACAQTIGREAASQSRITVAMSAEGAALLLPAPKGSAPGISATKRGTLYPSLGSWPLDSTGKVNPAIQSMIDTQRAVVTWWTVLGYDVAQLAATSLDALDTGSTTDKAEIARRRGMVRDWLLTAPPSKVLGVEMKVGAPPKTPAWTVREVRLALVLLTSPTMSKRREVIVGAFVAAGIAVTAFVIFLIGNDRRAFASKVVFQASFSDVQGLKPGAPVRMGGLDIGVVKAVAHGTKETDDRLYVSLEIVRSEAVRVRDDAVVKVANKGLLGDKMIELNPGTPGHASAAEGATLQVNEDSDFTNILSKATSVAEKTDKVLANIEKTTDTLADENVRNDVKESLKSFTVILNSVANAEGYAGKFVRSPEEAAKISRTLSNLERSSARLDQTLEGVNNILARIQKGPGLAHEILYGEKSADTVAHFGDVAAETALMLKGVRESNSVMHGVIYGDPSQQEIMANVTAMSSDMRQIVAGMKAGKGTLGALLVDPSVYEDMKIVLGNVERNDVLRALVRYSIKQDEKNPSVNVNGGAGTPKPASSGATTQR